MKYSKKQKVWLTICVCIAAVIFCLLVSQLQLPEKYYSYMAVRHKQELVHIYEQLGDIATKHQIRMVSVTLPLAAKQVELRHGYYEVDGLEIKSEELDTKIKKVFKKFRVDSIMVEPRLGMQIFIKNRHGIVLLDDIGDVSINQVVNFDDVKYRNDLGNNLYYLRRYTYREFMRISDLW